MIDKNDVRMPVQREDVEDLKNNEERGRKIQDLLESLNEVENKQELRLNENYYNKFHWFGGSTEDRREKSYFSYQEEAVYDFIFNLNKSGILSDQVGMGKTIEAGMIISELASRNELRSLLIIVPNEMMAEKWDYELASKFGIRYYRFDTEDDDDEKGALPGVKCIRNYDDFCRAVFDCVAKERFVEFCETVFSPRYTAPEGVKENIAEVVERTVRRDIAETVALINSGFEALGMEARVSFDGSFFRVDGTEFSAPYVYDRKGGIAKYLNGRQGRVESTLNNAGFEKRYNKTILRDELEGLFTIVGRYFTTMPEEISSVADLMTHKYPILVIPISYSEQKGEETVTVPFLNRSLFKKVEDYKHKQMVRKETGEIEPEFEEYRVIDFFIDVGYQTLIVDEVHDYIDVCAKMERRGFHRNPDNERRFPSEDYNRFELFDDYYFIKKSSLYKKLKELADRANRKIFLTATPIKSDMVDFYLLTLLASNKDSEAYRKIRGSIDRAYTSSEEREGVLGDLYNSFTACVDNAAQQFCDYNSEFLRLEEEDGVKTSRHVYPYFYNAFLLENINNAKLIREYLLSHIVYMTMEEIVLNLILSYYAENKGKAEADIRETIGNLCNLLSGPDLPMDRLFLQTRIVFRSILDNTVKMRFEEDFVRDDGSGKKVPIKRIRELLEMNEGPRTWHKTYRKYGIRHTRHQTYNLSGCEALGKLSKNKIERYKNLPVWPRRNGKILFLLRDDIFFDNFVVVERERPKVEEKPIRLEDLPNYDRIGSEENREERFNDAKKIFDYINDAMSGGKPVTHEPQSSRYESVDLDDEGMNDYKLALVSKLMTGRDPRLGAVSKKVLLFAENDREAIKEWFIYQKCSPLCTGIALDGEKLKEYEAKWSTYGVTALGQDWRVSEDTEDLNRYDGNLLIIIDPKRYEKGVDLQKADTIINFDINYDPLKMEQRIGRIDRIRPNGQNPEINIVSFVPFNNMSGFVINFFANEMKMFTQWMGETTGIVSVPEEGSSGKDDGRDVSFEGRVNALEDFYTFLYRLCRGTAKEEEVQKYAEDFEKTFGLNSKLAKIDFGYLSALRALFDRAFRNSISPRGEGYAVIEKEGKRVIRFNSSHNLFRACVTGDCAHCPDSDLCASGTRHNDYGEFSSAVRAFLKESRAYYADRYNKQYENVIINNSGDTDGKSLLDVLRAREAKVKACEEEVLGLLPERYGQEPFTISVEAYRAIFSPVKQLYWDEVVGPYMQAILNEFYKQCDSVLQGASLFERFIKTFSIAEFMINMEGPQA